MTNTDANKHIVSFNSKSPSPLPEWASGWYEQDHEPAQKISLSHCSCPNVINLERMLNAVLACGRCGRKDETIMADKLYSRFISTRLIKNTLDIRAGLAICANGYLELFHGKRIYLLRSVVHHKGQNPCIPFVQFIRGQAPLIHWWWFEYPISIESAMCILS